MPRLHAALLLLLLTACAAEPAKSEQAQDSAKPEPMPTSANPDADKPEPEPQPPAVHADSPLRPELTAFLEKQQPNIVDLPEDRRKALDKLAGFVKKQRAAGADANLTFICTHNSRRSQMGQLLAAASASLYGVEGVETWSGGTEATAFNPRAVAAMERAGFGVENPGGDNPHYEVQWLPEQAAEECFSKKYDDPFNPKESFAAVMVCSDADAACPFVPGADLRVSLPYEDPKVADDTDGEAAKYDERAAQIATEMLYLFAKVAEDS